MEDEGNDNAGCDSQEGETQEHVEEPVGGHREGMKLV